MEAVALSPNEGPHAEETGSQPGHGDQARG